MLLAGARFCPLAWACHAAQKACLAWALSGISCWFCHELQPQPAPPALCVQQPGHCSMPGAKLSCALQAMLQRAGIRTMLNELSSTVVFERPTELAFIRKWQLACEGDIAHVVVMPNITIDKLETFVQALIESRYLPAGVQGPWHPVSACLSIQSAGRSRPLCACQAVDVHCTALHPVASSCKPRQRNSCSLTVAGQ